jgi:ABC-type transport system involved in multi-copper enzyme maturation permease subunit
MGRLIGRILRVESIQWFARRESQFALAFLLLATVGYAMLLRVLLESDLVPAAVSLFTGTEPTGFHLAFTATRALLRLLALFLLLWGSTAIAGELEQGTLRMPLLHVPRLAFPLGKMVFFAAVAAVLAFAILGLSLAVGAWAFGLASVDVGRVTVQARSHLVATGLLATLLTLLPLWSVLALGLCMSCLVRSSQLALTLAIVCALVLWAASLLPGVGGWMFPSTLSWPLEVALRQSEGLRTLSLSQGIWQHCLVNAAWTAGLLALGTARFERRDLMT